MATTIDQLRKARLDKLEKLRELGIDPYPPKIKREQTISKALENDGAQVAVAGRVTSLRGHGKIIFGNIRDETGEIQVAFKSDFLDPKTFDLLNLLDIGDFLAVQGKVGKTQTGQTSVFASDFQIITKSILPLPGEWYGLKDVEERYRKRYLDMIMNQEVRDRLRARSKIVESIRDFLNKKGFLEVETPTLQPLYGGGFARPFSTHHNELDADLYLRISDEMYLKRLIVGGFDKVYEITKVFRNEGVDFDHNPEFTMFEAQIAYEDYFYGMDLIEEIIEHTAKTVLGSTKFTYQDIEMDVKRPWERYKVVEAIEKFSGLKPLTWKTLAEAKKAVKTKGIKDKKLKELDNIQTIGEVIAFAFEELVEEKLIQPTIIYDYPVEVSPLAKKCEDPRFTQRFEMFAFGSELGNNYSELNDPLDLYQRFVEEKKREKAGFEEAHQTDYDYLTAIEHGFPPTCGLSIGIDRLAIMLTNAKNIKEVIAFPTLRPESQKSKVDKQDFDQKLVIVIDPDQPEWKIMNTSAHAAAFLGNKMQSEFDTGKYFVTKDGTNLPRNSQYAIVTLSANKAELKALFKNVQESGLLHIGYVPEMMETTDDKELEDVLAKKPDEKVEFSGIGIFGPRSEVDKLTKRYTLWGKQT